MITWKELIGEILGTCFILLFGNGVVVSVVVFGLGNFESINWAWGLGVLFGIIVSAKLSGAHLNPAVSIALTIRGDLKPSKLPFYILAQIIGAFIGSLLVYMNYSEAILEFEIKAGILRSSIESIRTASLFATYPASQISNWNAFFDQFLGTTILVFLIFVINEEKNKIFDTNIAPILVSLVVVAIGMSFGVNAGYAINPARDLGPRIMTYMLGWGKIVFTVRDNYFIIPIISPILGGIFAVYLHKFLVKKNLEE
jgi:MIP family channel proteins